MGAVELVQELMAEGVEFATDGTRVRWRNSGGRMTPELVAELAAAKPDVIDYLCRDDPRTAPDIEAFHERAAIAEFDGGLSRADAEHLAASCQGYDNVVAFEAAVAAHRTKGGT